MTNLTEAEKAHGWRLLMMSVPNGTVRWSRAGSHVTVDPEEEEVLVLVSSGLPDHDVEIFDYNDIDALVLALLQAKGIHRRLRAEWTRQTRTDEGGSDGH